MNPIFVQEPLYIFTIETRCDLWDSTWHVIGISGSHFRVEDAGDILVAAPHSAVEAIVGSEAQFTEENHFVIAKTSLFRNVTSHRRLRPHDTTKDIII
jgi:hypothetical protein